MRRSSQFVLSIALRALTTAEVTNFPVRPARQGRSIVCGLHFGRSFSGFEFVRGGVAERIRD